TFTFSTATRDWPTTTVGEATRHGLASSKPKLMNTTASAAETDHRSRRPWGCLVQDVGSRLTRSVGNISKGRTTRHRSRLPRFKQLARASRCAAVDSFTLLRATD